MKQILKKKVVLVGPAYPLRGGIANFNEAFAHALQKEGHDVSLFSFYYQYPNFLFPGKSQYDNSQAPPKDLKIINTISSVNPISWGKTAQSIEDLEPDVVIIRFWLPFMGPSLGSVAKRLRKKKIKVVAITDNVIPHERRVGDKQLTRYFIKQCDGFITLSKSVMEDISKFTDNPNKISLPHPLYDTFGKKSTKEIAADFLKLDVNQNYLLFFGLIRPYKGLDIAIEAMADCQIREKSLKLIIAGEFYEKKEKYLDLIAALKLEDSIIVHDHYIPTEEVRYYFALSDAVVQPYKTATQSGITQVAYHFDKPMIVSNVGGLPEIVPDGKVGFVVPPDAKAFSQAILKIFENNHLATFEKNITEEKKKFEWSYFVAESLKFIEGI